MNERERLANEQGSYVSFLCQELVRHGGWFTIENPWTSDFWRASPFLQLVVITDVYSVFLHQCAYGLTLPGLPSNMFCKKATRIVLNITSIVNLTRRCPGSSVHRLHCVAWGSIKVNGKAESRARLAGRYPDDLCRSLARIVKAHLQLESPMGHRVW